MSQLKVQNFKVADLKPYEHNPRKNDSVVDRMVTAIAEFGFRIPIVTKADGTVIDGHLRLKAAKKMGLETVPCVLADDLTDAQIKAFRILANKSASWAQWDMELLTMEITDLKLLDFPLEMTGFDPNELARLLNCPAVEQGDAPQARDSMCEEHPITCPGDVWILGRHKLLCGDSTNSKILSAFIGNAVVDTLVYDPPYDVPELWKHAYPAPTRIVMHDYKRIVEAALCVSGCESVYHFVWDGITSWYTPNRPLARHKGALVGLSDAFWDFESAVYHDGKDRGTGKTVHNTRGSLEYAPLPNGYVHLQTIYQEANTAQDDAHKHSKPLAWVSALLRGCRAKVVLDMFCGSGSTVISCERMGMACLAVEIDPLTCDAIVRRWENASGIKAERLQQDHF